MNALLAQLDRRLARRGEPIYLQCSVGSPYSSVQIRMPALVRTLTVEQLIGSITQTNFFIICSPTDILKQQWPGGKTPPSTPRHHLARLILVSRPRDDVCIVLGTAQSRAARGVRLRSTRAIRIEINVLG